MDANQITFNISKSIIEHLMEQNNRQDDLSEIALAVYNKEISKLSDKVVDQITILMHKGIIKRIHRDGKYYYKLERSIEKE